MRVEKNSCRYHLGELEEVARWLLERSEGERVWLFDAPMGGGKTTLIKELCQILEVDEESSSPTFAIVNEYHTRGGDPLYHMDAYRLESEADGQQIGLGEYLDSGAYCFVEWPGVLGRLLPEGAFRVRIELEGEAERRITILSPQDGLLFAQREEEAEL